MCVTIETKEREEQTPTLKITGEYIYTVAVGVNKVLDEKERELKRV